MPGGFCGSWDGAANGPPDGRWNGTKRRSGSGSRSVGRRLKKSPKRGPNHRLHRRKWIEPATASLPHLGAQGADAGAAIPLQLEDAVGDGGGDVVELLLSSVSRHHSQSPGDPVSDPPAAPSARPAVVCLGRPTKPPQPLGEGLCSPAP